MRICQTCRTENPNTARFCAECGRAFGAPCATCGEELPGSARFCPACGSPVPLLDEAPEEMLKLVTVLFADVVSSTRRAEGMHPEDVRSLMSDFFTAMSEEIRREGGTVEKYIGDAVMAVFGVPLAHEDDPNRAVRAAERMQERLDRLNAAHGDDPPLEMRIGVNTGDVIAGGAAGQDLLVTGDAVNVAARLQEMAEPGSILIGERTARSIRGCFRLKPLEDVEVRGRDGSIAAWIVVGEEDIAVSPMGPVLSAPMVGRDSELSVLRSLFDRVKREGNPHLISVIGDAGVGKSRLVQEFIRLLEGEERVVSSRCPPSGEGLTLWPLARILRGEAGILDSDPPELAHEKLSKVVSKLTPELVSDRDRTLAAFAHTLGMEPRVPKSDPRSTSHQLIDAWRALLRTMAESGALVVLIEDLHWADQTMLDILTELSERPLGAVLFLCTARPDLLRNRSTWGGGSRNYSSVSLDPLTEDESAHLIFSLLGASDLPDHFSKRVLKRAEGNPFFLEEILRSLIDEGRLVQTDGGWGPRGKLTEVEIPDDVQAVILSRIDLLESSEKRVLQQAAVVGRNFWTGAVARLTGIDDLGPILRNLQQREFITERITSSLSGEREFSFKHVLIRDVAYESLPRRARGQAHAAVASWIEHIGKGRFRERAELLAHHYTKAFKYLEDDEYRRHARNFAMAASANAYRKAAFEQAEWYGRRAVELSTEPLERVEALTFLGSTHFIGDLAYRAYREAMSIVLETDPVDKQMLGYLASLAVIIPTRYRGSMIEPPPRSEIDELIETGNMYAAQADRARLLAAQVFLQVMGYDDLDDNGRAAAREALEIAEQTGDSDLISLVLDAVAGCHMFDGRFGEALRAHRRRHDMLAEIENPGEACDAYGMLAWSCTIMGRYKEAIEFATAGAELGLDLNPGGRLHGLSWRAQARFMTGDWDGALADQSEIEKLHEGLPGKILPIPYSMRAYAVALFIHELRGNDEEVASYRELLENAWKEQTPHERSSQSRNFVNRYLIHRGEFDRARAGMKLGKTKARSLQLEALSDLVGASGDWDAAPEVIALAREQAAMGELEGLPAFADRLEGRLAAASGQWAHAETMMRAAIDTFEGVGATWEQALTRLDLAELLAGGERPGEAQSLARAALSEFRRLRSVKEEDRARHLLETSLA